MFIQDSVKAVIGLPEMLHAWQMNQDTVFGVKFQTMAV
jgi:hypothetical protein